MSPEFDFSKLSDADLQKICEAGESGAGYHPFQQASALMAMRGSDLPSLQRMAGETERWVDELDQEVIDNLKSIMGGE